MKTEELAISSNCSGCGACCCSCPASAIVMAEDDCGYKYPIIDESNCCDCKKCIQVCTYKKPLLRQPLLGFAAINNDINIIKLSSSGGAFSGLSSSFIENKGVVCGCELELQDVISVKHTIVDNDNDLIKLYGSKYVQSNSAICFKRIKNYLESGKGVLFSGTPCQVAGLYGFLGKDYSNLYTIDLICHGIPNEKMFKDYIKEFEASFNGKVESFLFRDKKYGWHHHGSAKLESGDFVDIPSKSSSYFTFFLNSAIIRENCFSCPFAQSKRCADITLGDYWGLKKNNPDLYEKLDTDLGISAVLVNTKKGEELLERYGDKLTLFPTSVDSIIAGNTQLRHPATKGKNREVILNIYKSNGWEGVEKYFYSYRFKQFAVNVMKSFFPRRLRSVIKRIIAS